MVNYPQVQQEDENGEVDRWEQEPTKNWLALAREIMRPHESETNNEDKKKETYSKTMTGYYRSHRMKTDHKRKDSHLIKLYPAGKSLILKKKNP